MERFKKDFDVTISDIMNKYKYQETKLGDIRTDKDKILYQGAEMKITELFLKSLCKILKIPYKYAMYIDGILFEDNLNTLIDLHPDKDVTICIKDNNCLVNIVDESKKSFYVPDMTYLLEGIKIRDSLQEMWYMENFGFMFLFYGDKLKAKNIDFGFMLKIPMFLADNKITIETMIWEAEGDNNREYPINIVPSIGFTKFPLFVKDIEDEKIPDKIVDRLNAHVDVVELGDLYGYGQGVKSTIIDRESLNKVFNKVAKWNIDLLYPFGIDSAESLKMEKGNVEPPTDTYYSVLSSLLDVDVSQLGLDDYYNLVNNRWFCKLYSTQRAKEEALEKLIEEEVELRLNPKGKK